MTVTDPAADASPEAPKRGGRRGLVLIALLLAAGGVAWTITRFRAKDLGALC